jgi:hypothetical protein
MSGFQIELDRTHAKIDGDPVEVWVASVEADAYGDAKAKTPGEALRRLADEFDVEFGAMPRGNWTDHPDVDVRG